MKKHVTLSISKPCNKNFDTFERTPNGGFCDSCQKEVIDFTNMDNTAIVAFLAKKPQQICGRLKSSQLKTHLQKPTVTLFRRSLGIASISLFSLLVAPTAQAQDLVGQNSKQITATQKTYMVKGTVVDDKGLPLPGANVVLKGSAEGTVTNLDGKFEFPTALATGDVLVFSYLGFDAKEYKIKAAATKEITINIQFDASDIMLMGDIAVDEVYTSKKHKTKKNKTRKK